LLLIELLARECAEARDLVGGLLYRVQHRIVVPGDRRVELSFAAAVLRAQPAAVE
jgi:hypothetical protein